MVLFVGDKPSKNSDPNHAFKGAKCEARLKEWIESIIATSDYMVINRVDEYFKECVNSHVKRGNPVIALGNAASKALKDIPHFKLPHPSGLNRKLNNKRALRRQLDRARMFVSTAVQEYAVNQVRF